MIRSISKHIAWCGCLLAGPACAALPDGLSGAWYNPAQSGHGLSISLVDRGTRAAVLWHVYDADGNPFTLYVDGVVEGREIVGTAFAPSGMRFGEFDPDDIQLPEWGQVVLRFDSCLAATLSWTTSTPGFTDGSMPIEPLAPIAALPCSLPPPNTLSPGLYHGNYLDQTGFHEGWGMVDGEGRLWGGTLFRGAQVWQPPSFQLRAQVSLAEVATAKDDMLQLRLLTRGAAFGRLHAVSGQGRGGDESQLDFSSADSGLRQRWDQGAPANTVLHAPISVEQLAGTYAVPYLTPPLGFQAEGELAVAEDGSVCLRFRPDDGPDCDRVGRLGTPEGELGLIDFELRAPPAPDAPFIQPLNGLNPAADRGRGWLARVDGVDTLTLIGSDGETGFFLQTRRR